MRETSSAFQCSSASRKFLNPDAQRQPRSASAFQCSSASRKFLNWAADVSDYAIVPVSVLFSEPKIPQCDEQRWRGDYGAGFQCSSASRKFLNQQQRRDVPKNPRRFQCSSASRKFLNFCEPRRHQARAPEVSVLFSEPKIPQSQQALDAMTELVKFQCSSASRKFLNAPAFVAPRQHRIVSVLFSEPKIPQLRRAAPALVTPRGFSALQRAENSSIVDRNTDLGTHFVFQCSSASRKFLNRAGAFANNGHS